MPAGAKDDVFEVERIVSVRARRAKDPLLYRVRWKGFTEEDDTYEPADALAGAAGLLRQFIDKGRPQDMLGKVVNVRVGDETSRAVVREVLAERREYYVHYLGWSSTWDQWINADQVDGDSGTVSAAGHREPARSPKNRRRTESVSQQVGSERLTPSAPPADEDSSEEYIVDKIVGRRQRGGEWQYKVRWEGYGASDDTWEPVEHLSSCIGKVHQYIARADALNRKQTQEAKQTLPSKDEWLAMQLQRQLAGMRVQPGAQEIWEKDGSLSESDHSTVSEDGSENKPESRGSRTRPSQTRQTRQTHRTSEAPSAAVGSTSSAEPKRRGSMSRSRRTDAAEQSSKAGGAASAQGRSPSVRGQAQKPGKVSATERSAGSGQKQGQRACSNCGRALLLLGNRCTCHVKKSAGGMLGTQAPVHPAVQPRSGVTPPHVPGQEPALDAAASVEVESNEDAGPARKKRRSVRVAAAVRAEQQLQEQQSLKAAKEQRQQGARTKRRQGKNNQAQAAKEESADMFYPERIVGVSVNAHGHRCYQVKWYGYTDISLEPIERVQTETAFQDALDRYFAGQSPPAAEQNRAHVGKKTQASEDTAIEPWTTEEDNELKRLVVRDGPGKWVDKANELSSRLVGSTRSSSGVRSRWLRLSGQKGLHKTAQPAKKRAVGPGPKRGAGPASVVPLGASESEEESLDGSNSEEGESEDELEEEHESDDGDQETPIDNVHVLLAALRHPKHRWKADAATSRGDA